MNTRHLIGIASVCAAMLSAPLAHAQRARISGAPQPTPRQAVSPAGVPLGLPNPAGLPPPTVPDLSSRGTATGNTPIDAGIAAPTVVGGGGGVVVVQQSASGYGPNAMGAGPATRGPLSAVDIARAFLDADTNHDGQLSRAEAQRLSIPLGASFDDLDRDHDGMLSRFEYEDAFQ
jgi:glucose/arabinose dehydrogenase